MHGRLQACLNTLLLLHSPFMLCRVKSGLKGEVGGCALNNHGNYIVDHGKSWKNHGIVFLNFCGNPVKGTLANTKKYYVSNNIMDHPILFANIYRRIHQYKKGYPELFNETVLLSAHNICLDCRVRK